MKDELKRKKNKPPHLTGHHEALGCMKLTTSLCLWNQVPTCVCLSFAKCAKPRPSGNQPDAKENQLVGLRDIYLALWSQVLRMALQTVLGHRGRALFLDLGDAAGSANSPQALQTAGLLVAWKKPGQFHLSGAHGCASEALKEATEEFQEAALVPQNVLTLLRGAGSQLLPSGAHGSPPPPPPSR